MQVYHVYRVHTCAFTAHTGLLNAAQHSVLAPTGGKPHVMRSILSLIHSIYIVITRQLGIPILYIPNIPYCQLLWFLDSTFMLYTIPTYLLCLCHSTRVWHQPPCSHTVHIPGDYACISTNHDR